ncbi:MAG TPA: hypothetical protein VD905_01020 [Flavobacteriales bacterium]|nr:hypothetical protein [Flavobacteriales bacterium]
MTGRVFMCFILFGTIVVNGYSNEGPVKLIQTIYSKKAVRLVLKNMGKKVGSGTSLSLLTYYEKKSKAKTGLKFSLSKKALPYIAVGDELYFSGTYKNTHVNNAIESTSSYAGPMRYAIVVGLKDENTLVIACQNMHNGAPSKAFLNVTELKVEDPNRYENINVYGLVPKNKRVKPEKLLKNSEDIYEITRNNKEKSNYFVETDFTK